MKFTFNSEQYGTTVEINFEAETLDEIRDMFDQFLRGSGFHFVDEEDVYTNQENDNVSEECVHETDIKPWVGLTDTEIEIYGNQFSGSRLVKAIEALLRERNT